MLVLLYADQRGDLRVVLTIRAKTLSSCKSYMCFFCACLLCFVLWNHFFIVWAVQLLLRVGDSSIPRYAWLALDGSSANVNRTDAGQAALPGGELIDSGNDRG